MFLVVNNDTVYYTTQKDVLKYFLSSQNINNWNHFFPGLDMLVSLNNLLLLEISLSS